jgi:predicted RNA-binding Zn-ribbon protein involved in translation (DUF1610 family)
MAVSKSPAAPEPCAHDSIRAFAGMRRMALHDETVEFACPSCPTTFSAARCRARNHDGTRCKQPARIGFVTSGFHWKLEFLPAEGRA